MNENIIKTICSEMNRYLNNYQMSKLNETEIITKTLIGKWTTDGNTVYEFNEGGKGTLIVPVAKLPFTYKLENNQLFIDFENEDSEDSSYSYIIEDNKLSIQNSNGTFVFSRVEEE